MKIDNHSLNLTEAIAQSQPNGSTAKTNSGRRQSGSDKVQISDMAALLFIDPQKIAQLTAAVQNGTYNVSPSQIANSIIGELSS
jgi:anti-sigma28 factor (negative regulator of flagellin synthesis)